MRRQYLLISVVVVLLASLSANAAQPYVCRSNGKTILTDQPCESLGNGGNAASSPSSTARFSQAPPAAVVQPAPKPVPVAAPPKTVPKTTAPAKENSGSGFGSLVLLIGVGALVWFLRREFKEKPLVVGSVFGAEAEPIEEVIPYAPAPLMSRYEIDMFSRLRAALPECDVFPQVPLAAFIRIDRKKAGNAYAANSYRWQNRIGQQRGDYLVCLKSDLSVVAAVELDDPSHDRDEAEMRDKKKSKSLADAGIQLVRWRVEQMPTAQEIRGRFSGGDSAVLIGG